MSTSSKPNPTATERFKAEMTAKHEVDHILRANVDHSGESDKEESARIQRELREIFEPENFLPEFLQQEETLEMIEGYVPYPTEKQKWMREELIRHQDKLNGF